MPGTGGSPGSLGAVLNRRKHAASWSSAPKPKAEWPARAHPAFRAPACHLSCGNTSCSPAMELLTEVPSAQQSKPGDMLTLQLLAESWWAQVQDTCARETAPMQSLCLFSSAQEQHETVRTE